MTSVPPDIHPSYADALRVACTQKTKDPGEKPTLENVNTSPPRSSFKNSVTFKFSRFEFSSQEAVKLLYEKYQKRVAAIKILGQSKTIILAFWNEMDIHEVIKEGFYANDRKVPCFKTISNSQRVLNVRINDLPGQEEETLRVKLEAALSKIARVIQIDFQYYYGNTGWLQDHCYAILEPNPETFGKYPTSPIGHR
ncbi:uncharacterized protein VTP21DRAFT_9026 [Calcarisporiella thermophila]|uniref:uncharacterized protein n=1 Tax=Calcarisporiella thermophila TaxID=911321 RepID=UPI00374420FC